ncbi:MAG TPA: DUF1801 domain-containing protein [Anaerolineales bacterium]|nr:DUF1801 domain-containing protein [Anaerolineales bacterium]
MAEKTVDGYILGLEGWQREVVTQLRKIVREAAPEAKESIKWAQPVYESHGPFCYIKAFQSAVNIGFWRGADLKDPGRLLQGSGEKMRHVKLTDEDAIQAEVLADFVRQAVRLNRVKGDPTKGE